MLISMPSSSGRAPPDDLSLSLAIPNPPPGLPEGQSQGSEAVAEVEFERATGLQALREQGGRAALGRVRHDQLAEPPGVGADRVCPRMAFSARRGEVNVGGNEVLRARPRISAP